MRNSVLADFAHELSNCGPITTTILSNNRALATFAHGPPTRICRSALNFGCRMNEITRRFARCRAYRQRASHNWRSSTGITASSLVACTRTNWRRWLRQPMYGWNCRSSNLAIRYRTSSRRSTSVGLCSAATRRSIVFKRVQRYLMIQMVFPLQCSPQSEPVTLGNCWDNQMERALIATELRRRADKYLRQSHLVVDYYRVRRRVAYRLPLRRLVLPRLAIPGLPDYPWATWLSWEIEERINALGWTGHLFSDRASRTATKLDLYSLSRWPTYRQLEKPDLCQAHFARTLALGERQWPWLEDKIRCAIGKALRRMVDGGLPTIREGVGRFRDAGEILAQPNAQWLVGNVRVIYAIGMALAANAASHPAANELHRCVENVLEALFQLRRNGFSEAVAYDGYILYFLMSWIEGLPSESMREILRRPDIARFVCESFMVSTPGDVMAVAELNDVEPKQMAFHEIGRASCR